MVVNLRFRFGGRLAVGSSNMVQYGRIDLEAVDQDEVYRILEKYVMDG
jgi:hypothetical protein